MGFIREPEGVDFIIGPSRIDARSMALLGAWIRAHKQGVKVTVTYALEAGLSAEEFLSVVDEMLSVESPPTLDRADALEAMSQARVIATARINGWLTGAAWTILNQTSGTPQFQCILGTGGNVS